MNDELKRRLEAADPLAVGGVIRTPAQIDQLKERAMTGRGEIAARPRAIGLGVVGAVALAGMLLVGSFGARPTLAFSSDATMANEAQMAAADAACSEPINGVARLPLELISLELFGNGGVAMYGNDEFYGYCMVLVDGDTVQAGIRIMGSAPELDPFIAAAGSTEFEGETLSIIVGSAPEGATSVAVIGLDGVAATVVQGRYGLWLPQALFDEAIELVALDASGTELLREALPGEQDGLRTPTEGEPSPSR